MGRGGVWYFSTSEVTFFLQNSLILLTVAWPMLLFAYVVTEWVNMLHPMQQFQHDHLDCVIFQYRQKTKIIHWSNVVENRASDQKVLM